MTANTVARQFPREISTRMFGVESKRYMLVTSISGMGEALFVIRDAAVMHPETGKSSVIAAARSLPEVLAKLPAEDVADFHQSGKIEIGKPAIDLGKVPVKVLKFDPERGTLVRCYQHGQKWYANPSAIVAA